MTTPITIGTFNLENLFMRYVFFYPTRKKKGETEEEAGKREEKESKKLQDLREKGGYIQNLTRVLEDKKTIKSGQTSNTAKVILAHKPDIMAMQEVEDMEALRQFNARYLESYYGYRMLIEGNDQRNINVCVLSRYPMTWVRTNIQVHDPVTGLKLFSRDCLEVGIALEDGAETALTLFVNHLKSQLAMSAEEKQKATEKRGRQVDWVASMLKRRYGSDLRGGDFAVLGDFNANYDAAELQSLLRLNGLENIVQTRPLQVPGQDAVTDADRWTHYFEGDNTTSQLDYILLSPTLAERSAGEPVIIEKGGLADYVKQYTGDRFPGVAKRDSEASDHCAVFATLQL